MRILPLVLIALLLSPVAAGANYQLPVREGPGLKGFQMVGSDNYSLILQNPPALYGITGSNLTTLGLYFGSVGFVLPDQINSNKNFNINIGYNGPHSISFNFIYERHGFFPFYSWSANREVRQDGTVLCVQQDSGGLLGGFSSDPLHYLGPNIFPNPFASLTLKATSTDAILNTTPTRLYYTLGDGLSDNLHETCLNPATQDTYVNVTSITEGYDLSPTAPDGLLYGTTVAWRAKNMSTQFSILNATGNSEADSCGGLQVNILILNFCFDPSQLFQLFFAGLGVMLKAMLGIIPGGQILYNIISIPFNLLIGLIQFIYDVIFNNGAPYGIAGFFWMHIVFAFTLGCVATSFTRNWSYPFMFPIKLTMAGLYVTIYGAYFFFWLLPSKLLSLIAQAWVAITNPIP